jgi:hypothetical protein
MEKHQPSPIPLRTKPDACPRCRNSALQMTSSQHEISCQLCGWTSLICLCPPGTDHFADRLTVRQRPSGRVEVMRGEVATELATRLTARITEISEAQHRLGREKNILSQGLRDLRAGQNPSVVEAQIASQLAVESAS